MSQEPSKTGSQLVGVVASDGDVNDHLRESCFYSEKHCALMRSSVPVTLPRNPTVGCAVAVLLVGEVQACHLVRLEHVVSVSRTLLCPQSFSPLLWKARVQKP